jgi:nucleotide-binding universal stress UspA family protein
VPDRTSATRTRHWFPVLVIKANRLQTLEPEECAGFCSRLAAKVLYATDFSDGAEAALTALRDRVMTPGAEVHLVHVQDETRLVPHLSHRLEEFDRIDHERLDRIASSLREHGAGTVTRNVVLGHPVAEIVRAAEASAAHLVVLGRHGRSRLREMLLGSTAHTVATLSPVPVLVVPETTEYGAHHA